MATIYCDRESGTWFTCPTVTIETETWTDSDWGAWADIMGDADRGAYSEHYIEAHDYYKPASERPKLLSPTEWCETEGV
jgi:hypothetical protein